MDYHISTTLAVTLVSLAVWEIIWKGFALWKAAQKNQKGWYIALLAINSAGLLSIIYLLKEAKTNRVREDTAELSNNH